MNWREKAVIVSLFLAGFFLLLATHAPGAQAKRWDDVQAPRVDTQGTCGAPAVADEQSPQVTTEKLPWDTMDQIRSIGEAGAIWCSGQQYHVLSLANGDTQYYFYFSGQKFVAASLGPNAIPGAGPAHVWFGTVLNGTLTIEHDEPYNIILHGSSPCPFLLVDQTSTK